MKLVRIKMYCPFIITLILEAFVIALLILGCSGPVKVEKEIKINIDSIYIKALEVAFNGRCFYSPPSLEQFRSTKANEAVFDESYVYFANRFENFIIDSTLEFEYKELNELVKKSGSNLEIDSFYLSTYDNKTFSKASEATRELSFNDLPAFANQNIQEKSSFNGFIIFSKPLLKMNSDQSYELFVRVIKMIDSPRNCYVRILVRDNIIVESTELVYSTSLTFR